MLEFSILYTCCLSGSKHLTHNGYVYETFGISKHIPIKLQLLLIRAEIPDNAMIAKCFIYDVCALHKQRALVKSS